MSLCVFSDARVHVWSRNSPCCRLNTPTGRERETAACKQEKKRVVKTFGVQSKRSLRCRRHDTIGQNKSGHYHPALRKQNRLIFQCRMACTVCPAQTLLLTEGLKGTNPPEHRIRPSLSGRGFLQLLNVEMFGCSDFSTVVQRFIKPPLT